MDTIDLYNLFVTLQSIEKLARLTGISADRLQIRLSWVSTSLKSGALAPHIRERCIGVQGAPAPQNDIPRAA